MDDHERIRAYLAGPVDESIRGFSKKLGDGLLRQSGGARVRADFGRFIGFDEVTDEIVMTVVIEVRIGGPDSRTPH